MIKAAIALLALTTVAHADDTSWHLLTQSYSGTVSLIKNLSKHDCEFAKNRALGQPATDDEVTAAYKRAQDQTKQAYATCASTDSHVVDSVAGLSIYCEDHKPLSWTAYNDFHGTSPGDIRSAECFQ